MEKLREAEAKKSDELNYLKRCGVAIEVNLSEIQQPCLINLAADPMLSGTLFYLIPPGAVRIGRIPKRKSERYRRSLDIVLDSPLVKPLHWLVHSSICDGNQRW